MQDKHFEVQFLYDRGDLLKVLEYFDDEFFEESYQEYPDSCLTENSFAWILSPQGDDYWLVISRELSEVNPYEE